MDVRSPRELLEGLQGHRVRVTLATGARREGQVIGFGPSGFQITSGIGGRVLLHYGEVDDVEDLGAEG